MTAPVQIFKYSDVAAPVLSGLQGSQAAVFDACLINGYAPLPVASITRAGSVATVSLDGNVTGPYTGYAVTAPVMSFEGADGSTTFTDSTGTCAWTAGAGATISTTQAAIGSSSLKLTGTSTGYITTPANPGGPFDFGCADFTVEYYAYQTSQPTNAAHLGVWSTQAGGNQAWLLHTTNTGGGDFRLYFGASLQLTMAAFPLNQWVHVALVRRGDTFMVFLNGVLWGSVTAPQQVINITGATLFAIGRTMSGTIEMYPGYIDALRITKGVGLYTKNFTPPTSITSYPIPPDNSLVTGNYVNIAGADQAEYNGRHQITVIDDKHFTFTVSGAPTTPATGTITRARAGIGDWQSPFRGGNVTVYRTSDPSSCRHYLQIDERGLSAGGHIEAMACGFESMTDQVTGTMSFPNASNGTNIGAGGAPGMVLPKTNTLGGNSRTWTLIGDGKRFHWFPQTGSASPHCFFGDIISEKPGDAYKTLISGSALPNNAANSLSLCNTAACYNSTSGLGYSRTGYIARSYTQIGSSQQVMAQVITNANGQNAWQVFGGIGGGPVVQYPPFVSGQLPISPVNGSLYFMRPWLMETYTQINSQVHRGYVPGLWVMMGNVKVSDYVDHYQMLPGGSLLPAGAQLMTIQVTGNQNTTQQTGAVFIDATGPWE